MKKLLLVIFLFLFITSYVYAKKMPDPFYLNSDVINIDEEAQKSKPQKVKDQRSLNEKTRALLHLPPPKTIYYHNIDKSKTPITMEDYFEISAEKLRTDVDIPEPEFNNDKDFIFPDPQFRVISYNTPPGQRNIDLTQVTAKRTVSSPAILSPDKKKMVYTKSFYYPQTTQTASAAYVIPVNGSLADAYDILYKTNVIEGSTEPIFNAGMDFLEKFKFTTLFPLDFSKDSNKIAFKEKIGGNHAQTWVTNIIVYDFTNQTLKRLTAIREAIINYWRQKKQIELKDYMWDIFPLGWDKDNPDKIIVYAYAYTKNKPLFLGTWSIDADKNICELISIDSTDANIDLHGFGLLEIKMQH